MRETAEGAALVTNEYKKLVRENEMPNIITTCCPSVNDLIEKYYPDCAKYMAPVVSPMVAHGRYIKKIYGSDVKVVFLGPCIAKKQEAIGDERVFGAVDAILTFEDVYKRQPVKNKISFFNGGVRHLSCKKGDCRSAGRVRTGRTDHVRTEHIEYTDK